MIEAIEFTGTGHNLKDVYEFVIGTSPSPAEESKKRWHDHVSETKNQGFTINTLEGNMIANVGDFIIKGVQGKFYPCKPDIFWKTYEEVQGGRLRNFI